MISSNLQKQQFVWLRVKSESMTPREVEKQASGATDPFRVLSIGKSRERERTRRVLRPRTLMPAPNEVLPPARFCIWKSQDFLSQHHQLGTKCSNAGVYGRLFSVLVSPPYLGVFSDSEIWALGEFAKPSVNSNHSSGNKQEAEEQIGLQGIEQWHLRCSSG